MQKFIISSISLLLISFFLIKAMPGIDAVDFVDNANIDNNLSLEGNRHHNGQGDTTVVEIKTEGIELSYSVTELRAKAGDILRIRYINGSDMNHNLVLVREEADIRPVGIAALQAISNDWIPEKEMDRILAYSALAHSGDTVEFSFQVPPPGIYPYICTYSAHWTQMQGRLISTE